MRWYCIPSKNLATEPLPVAPVVPVQSSVKKYSSCKCVSVRCVPLSCWKRSQPLVLRSTPPVEIQNLTGAVEVSAPDAKPAQVSATEAVSRVVHESQI